MKLRFQESEINKWSMKYLISSKEEALIKLKYEIQSAGCLNKFQLGRLAHWKSPRSSGKIKKNDESYIIEITSWSFKAKEERSRIEVLTLLDGVLWPSASAILHLFHNEPYPLLDFRALWSASIKKPNQYSFSFWWEYVEFCREIAQRNYIDMRTLDRALWQYSKENQV